jgi:hypothetical protein
VFASGLFLASLGLASLLQPRLAKQFLGGFAGSAAGHYIELVIRGVVGLGFIVAAQRLQSGVLFQAAGWVLVVTTVALAAVPWRRHQEFARWSVPKAMAYLPLIGVISLLLGGVVLASAYAAIAA